MVPTAPSPSVNELAPGSIYFAVRSVHRAYVAMETEIAGAWLLVLLQLIVTKPAIHSSGLHSAQYWLAQTLPCARRGISNIRSRIVDINFVGDSGQLNTLLSLVWKSLPAVSYSRTNHNNAASALGANHSTLHILSCNERAVPQACQRSPATRALIRCLRTIWCTHAVDNLTFTEKGIWRRIYECFRILDRHAPLRCSQLVLGCNKWRGEK